MHHRSYLLWFPVIVITAAVGWVNQLVTCVRSDNLRGFATLLLASLTGAFAPRKGVPCRKTLDVGDVCSWFTLPPNLQQAVEVQPRHAFLTHSLKTIRLRTYLVPGTTKSKEVSLCLLLYKNKKDRTSPVSSMASTRCPTQRRPPSWYVFVPGGASRPEVMQTHSSYCVRAQTKKRDGFID